MDNFLGLISSSSNDDDSDDELILHTLLSAAHNIVCQRGESWNVEKKHRKSINRNCIAANKFWYVITLPLIVYTIYRNSKTVFVWVEIYSYVYLEIFKMIMSISNWDGMLDVNVIYYNTKMHNRSHTINIRHNRRRIRWVFENVWEDGSRMYISFLWVCYRALVWHILGTSD